VRGALFLELSLGEGRMEVGSKKRSTRPGKGRPACFLKKKKSSKEEPWRAALWKKRPGLSAPKSSYKREEGFSCGVLEGNLADPGQTEKDVEGKAGGRLSR